MESKINEKYIKVSITQGALHRVVLAGLIGEAWAGSEL